jgi:flagellar biosynthesis GTPase FlhF
MQTILSTERIAIQALETASREHTTQAVRLLAKHYGFDEAEALAKVGLTTPSAPQTSACKPTPTPAHVQPQQAPARDDVVARLLQGDDPVPVQGSSSDDESSSAKRAPKPRLTPTQKTSRKAIVAAEKQRKQEEKKQAKLDKENISAAVKAMRGAQKSMKACVADAAKAAKEAAKQQKEAAKQQKEAAKQAAKEAKEAAKQQKEAAKQQKEAAKRAAKEAKEAAKQSPEPTLVSQPAVVEIAELEEDELEVKRVVIQGVTYLRSDSGTVFDAESHDEVGQWNEESQSIVS